MKLLKLKKLWKLRCGFTMIEMLITLGLFLFIGSFTLLSFRDAGKSQDARREALRFVAAAREMERRTLSGSPAPEVNISAPRGGYGIRVAPDGTSYATVVAPNADDLTTLSTLTTTAFPPAVILEPKGFTFLFTQPKGALCARESGGTQYCGLCRMPDGSTCLSPIPLATTPQQTTTFDIKVGGSALSTVVMNLVSGRLSAQ